jgi:hypothetical protein
MIWWVWSAIALIAVGGFAYWRSGARTRRREKRKIRRAITTCLTDDVAALEADLHQLEYDLGGRYHYPEVRRPYDRVVSSIASARRSIAKLGDLEGAYQVTETLAEGRYALACVRAGIDDEPLPERRLPCFFNPQHGPSVTDVLWTSYGDREVQVPACAADATRIAAGEKPDSREVWTGWRTVPYWEAAPPAFLWYSTGYFGGDWPASPADVALAVNYCLIGPVPRMSADGTIVHPLIFEDEDAEIDDWDG